MGRPMEIPAAIHADASRLQLNVFVINGGMSDISIQASY